MKAAPVRGYRGGYLIGFITIAVVAVRAFTFYLGQPNLKTVITILVAYSLLYTLEPMLLARFPRLRLIYFPIQTGLVLALTVRQPFLDISNVLYIPLGVQAMRAFPRPTASGWMGLYAALLGLTLILGMGWAPGIALYLLFLAGGAFMISYDLLYSQTLSDQAESQRLLAELQQAHQKLREYAAQAEALATTRERNRLARELHDTVSQLIFSIKLNARAARTLLEKDRARVPEQLDLLQDLTGSALQQLRALITQYHSQEKP